MNRIGTCLLVALALLAAAAFAEGPAARVDETEFDFGTIEQGANVSHTYVIANDGDAPLSIGRVETSCGCTAAKPTRQLVPPGETTDIRVDFRSGDRKGKQHKVVTVHTSDPNAAQVHLILKGLVRVLYELDPPRLNLLRLAPGAVRTERVTLRSRDDADAIVNAITADDANLTIAAEDGTPIAFPLTIPAGAEVPLTAVYRMPEKPRGFYYGRATFEIDGSPPLHLRVSVRAKETP